MLHSRSVIAVPPGPTIREQLEARGMSQKEFASRMGMSEKHISHLINGKVELTQDTALRLESVLGLPAKFWNNLEALYRKQIARANAELQMEQDEEITRLVMETLDECEIEYRQGPGEIVFRGLSPDDLMEKEA